MIKFPMEFEVEASGTSGISSLWTSQAEDFSPIDMAIPPQFKGPGGGYSPEDLFALAVLNCMIATFKVYAEKGGVDFQDVEGKTVLTVDKSPTGTGFEMTHLNLTIDVLGCNNLEKGRKLLELAVKECAISNSIKSGKTFNLNVS